jgi:type VI secretion system Hcp family effector
MAAKAFISFFDKAEGESVQKGKEKWVEIGGWDWAVEADSSWTRGGGASVGKPSPGRLAFEHRFDTASTVLLGHVCSGKAFPKVELQVTKAAAGGAPETCFTMTMEGVFVTHVSNAGTDDGIVEQRVELVFKTVRIAYRPQDARTGQLGAPRSFGWDIPAGTVTTGA